MPAIKKNEKKKNPQKPPQTNKQKKTGIFFFLLLNFLGTRFFSVSVEKITFSNWFFFFFLFYINIWLSDLF